MAGVPASAIEEAIRYGHDTVRDIASYLDVEYALVRARVADMCGAGELRRWVDSDGYTHYEIRGG